MADVKAHILQAQHNQKCSEELLTGAKYLDWSITTAFYAAVHYAEAGFTKTPIQHSEIAADRLGREIHAFRKDKVREYYADECWKSYRKLLEASKQVRYLIGINVAPGTEAQQYYLPPSVEKLVKDDLNIIKSKIASISGLTF
jgi:hypothetical protein